MLTRCPHCQTTFRVSQAQLDAARGKVRCGKCQQVFNAQEHISQPIEAQQAPSTASNKSPPPIAPQIDWLHQEHNTDFEHIDLGSSADTSADIEIPGASIDAADIEFDANQREDEADDTLTEAVIVNTEPFAIEVNDATVTVNQEGQDIVAEKATTSRLEDAQSASKDSLIPGEVNDASQNIERDITLPGITPAFEDDAHLNAHDERGLGDLQDEVHRQLHAPMEDIENSETEFDAYDSMLGYIEEAEELPKKTSPVEKIELSALPGDNSKSVDWSEDVYHDPEIPAALRSSMQALEKRKKRSPLLTTLMAMLLLILIAGLGLQFIVFRSYNIATQWPQTRPLLTRACHYLPCVYSGRREPRKIQLVNRDIRVEATAKHALLISATLLNRAGYAQPYPRVDIKLSDLSGELVAERVFSPRDYLKRNESRLKLLRPDIPTVITLKVLDPGSEAVNFEFRFL